MDISAISCFCFPRIVFKRILGKRTIFIWLIFFLCLFATWLDYEYVLLSVLTYLSAQLPPSSMVKIHLLYWWLSLLWLCIQEYLVWSCNCSCCSTIRRNSCWKCSKICIGRWPFLCPVMCITASSWFNQGIFLNLTISVVTYFIYFVCLVHTIPWLLASSSLSYLLYYVRLEYKHHPCPSLK